MAYGRAPQPIAKTPLESSRTRNFTVDAAQLETIVDAVMGSMFGLTPQAAAPAAEPSPLPARALVSITGSWNGAVEIQTTPALVSRLTALVHEVAADEVDREMLDDTMGELANMIGGNVKAQLAPPCSLSLPLVVDGDEPCMRIPGSQAVLRVSLVVAAEPLQITVSERAPKSDGAC